MLIGIVGEMQMSLVFAFLDVLHFSALSMPHSVNIYWAPTRYWTGARDDKRIKPFMIQLIKWWRKSCTNYTAPNSYNTTCTASDRAVEQHDECTERATYPTGDQSGKVLWRRWSLKNKHEFIGKRGAGLGDDRRACTGKGEYEQGPAGDLPGLLEWVSGGRRCCKGVEGSDYEGPRMWHWGCTICYKQWDTTERF